MKYAAYESKWSYPNLLYTEERSPLGDTVRRIKPNAIPIISTETYEQLRTLARAYFYDHPEATLQLTNPDGLIQETMHNKLYFEKLATLQRKLCFVITFLTFALTILIFNTFTNFSFWALLLQVGFSMLYVICVKLKIQNEIESAVVCEIILILLLILVPVLAKAVEVRNGRQHPTFNTPSVTTQPHFNPKLGTPSSTLPKQDTNFPFDYPAPAR